MSRTRSSDAGNVTIRMACIDDLSALFDLLDELHPGEPPWKESQTKQAEAMLRRIIDTQDRGLFVAEDSNMVVGTVDVVIIPNLTRDLAPLAVLENFVVAAKFRRKGIGRQLLNAGIAFAREQGCYKVELVSAASRLSAHNVYIQAGFDFPVSGFRHYLIDMGVADA